MPQTFISVLMEALSSDFFESPYSAYAELRSESYPLRRTPELLDRHAV
jgi:hypothetical protein